ncbi:hypothetical protein IWX65_003180 [Arthrobacter sp. CAN_A214]|uniref:hypothetical protein n=1 Tax=Arthrobacter sp. CAN_A214 TaxID=2787720 RepID=UPI0018C9A1D7
MGTTDYIAEPTSSITLTPDLSDTLGIHPPRIQAPAIEDLLEDRINAEPAGLVGPVDYAPVSDEHRRLLDG